jgi:hypothetical protein
MSEAEPKREILKVKDIQFDVVDSWVYYIPTYEDGSVGNREDTGFGVSDLTDVNTEEKLANFKAQILADGVPKKSY